MRSETKQALYDIFGPESDMTIYGKFVTLILLAVMLPVAFVASLIPFKVFKEVE